MASAPETFGGTAGCHAEALGRTHHSLVPESCTCQVPSWKTESACSGRPGKGTSLVLLPTKSHTQLECFMLLRTKGGVDIGRASKAASLASPCRIKLTYQGISSTVTVAVSVAPLVAPSCPFRSRSSRSSGVFAREPCSTFHELRT
jgi:hypothetical protein